MANRKKKENETPANVKQKNIEYFALTPSGYEYNFY